MPVIGSARSDESGKFSGGKRGDQRQSAVPDLKGEVSRQAFYEHKKGWVVLRPMDASHALLLARAMATACDNPHIGYSQSDRLSIIGKSTDTQEAVNCDCSSLVRQCIIEATGRDPGNFTTATEAKLLTDTGLFIQFNYVPGIGLIEGDVLVTRTKGHTAIVIEGDRPALKTVHEIALEVIDGKWGVGTDRMQRLHAAGYDYATVQIEVNEILRDKPKPVQHISQRGIDLIKIFESCRLTAYQLAGETYYTIGYGHHGADVLPNMTISQERADELLRLDLVKFEQYVRQYVTDIELTQCRFDALVSYVYNRGPKGLKQLAANCSTVDEYAAGIVTYWGSAQRYKNGLLRRRRKEQELFLSGD